MALWGSRVTLGFWDILVIVFVCCITALAALALLIRTMRTSITVGGKADTGTLSLLGNKVIDCHRTLRDQLDRDGWNGDLYALRGYFNFRFTGLPANFPAPDSHGVWVYGARDGDDPATLTLRRKGSVTTITIQDPATSAVMQTHMARQREHVRHVGKWLLALSPHPKWIVDEDGVLTWGNDAYRALERQAGGDADRNFRPVLVPDIQGGDSNARRPSRVRMVPTDGGPERWFDVTMQQTRHMTLYQGADVTEVVKAETAQRTFVQTLTKTFAQLAIGLAIFDRNRRLALFNPALVDMTRLKPEFLSSRPDHLAFFDTLRDGKIMPEPRDYSSWRDQIIDLISRAENGQYQETWSLPQGGTYRVTGRPHPNGAVAFLFEDISAEITLTRRFREQLDLSQSVMEALDDALAVFSPQGLLSYANTAYQRLWNLSDGQSQLDQRVSDVSRHWQTLCEPDPIWGEFRDFVGGFEDRSEWDARVRMRDGRPLECRFKPLLGGATLAAFRVASVPEMAEIQRAR